MAQALIRLIPKVDVETFITASSLPLLVEDYTGGILLVKTHPDPKHHALAAQMAAALQKLADQDSALQAAKTKAEAEAAAAGARLEASSSPG